MFFTNHTHRILRFGQFNLSILPQVLFLHETEADDMKVGMYFSDFLLHAGIRAYGILVVYRKFWHEVEIPSIFQPY